MRQNGTLSFLLGDHLGSTSLVTDANGQNPIETRYKAWGEVRYTTPNTTLPTNYTYTGQYSHTADFGLMFYNARWYDSSLGRFAQADSVVAGGVQGLDRYAYVNNSPINYTDPTGHRCTPEDECETPSGNSEGDGGSGDSVKLTSVSDPGFKGKYSGKQFYQFYQLMVSCTGCWWYKYSSSGTFTIEMFLGLMIMQEGSYPQNSNALQALKQIFAQRLFVGGGLGDTYPYCPSGTCFNGIFNYLAATSQSARTNIDTFVIGNKDIKTYIGPGSISNWINYDGGKDVGKITSALNTASDLGHYALHPNVLYGRHEGPSEYGNYDFRDPFLVKLRTNNIPDNKINWTATDTIYLYFGNAAYFSIDQYNHWLNP